VSAVLHADERHKELSERYGHDVYHYHLHVVYVPVVQKEIKWTKRAAPELVGKVKAVIPQINHTEKWPRRKVGGKFINEYSKLQDRYHEHMTAAGFADLQRGERGSAAEHLTAEEYKYQQEKKRREEAEKQAEQSEKRLAQIDHQVEIKQSKSEKLDEQITVKEKAKATLDEVNAMGHSIPLVPGVHLSESEAKKLKALARKGVGNDKRAEGYQKKIETLEENIRNLNNDVKQWKQSYHSIITDRDTWKKNYERLWAEVKDFIHAIRSAPMQLLTFIREGIHQKQHKEVSR
jgi:prefoldin subunit 5